MPDPATIAAAGSFLQGVGSVGGLFGGKSKGGATYADILSAERHRIRHTVEDATKAGIHPLYALGSASGSSLGGFVNGDDGSVLSRGAQAAGESLLTYAQLDAARKDQALREKEQRSTARLQEAQAELLQAQASELKRGQQNINAQPAGAQRATWEDEVKQLIGGIGNVLDRGPHAAVPRKSKPGFDFTSSDWASYEAVEQEHGEPIAWPYAIIKFIYEMTNPAARRMGKTAAQIQSWFRRNTKKRRHNPRKNARGGR